MKRDGYDALWAWFGLSRSAWLSMPRSLMHEMPDDWQRDMARLLAEWDKAWRGDPAIILARSRVFAVDRRGRIGKWPDWVTDYRHSQRYAEEIAAARGGLLLITLPLKDPRRAAWLQHLRNAGNEEVAQAYERARLPFDADSDWPPESALVEPTGLGSWSIPWGTPEHAAHLAAWRLTGRAGIERAQDIDLATRSITAKSRWPALGAPAEATDGKTQGDSR